jgi:hypothetical protein
LNCDTTGLVNHLTHHTIPMLRKFSIFFSTALLATIGFSIAPEGAWAKGRGGGRSYGRSRTYSPSRGTGSVRVRGYVRQDGTYVRPHTRTNSGGGYSFSQPKRHRGNYGGGLNTSSNLYNSSGSYNSSGAIPLYPSSLGDQSAQLLNPQLNSSSRNMVGFGDRQSASAKAPNQSSGEYCGIFLEQLSATKTQNGDFENSYQDSGSLDQFRIYMNWGYASFLKSKNQDALSWFRKAQAMTPQNEEASCAVQVTSLAIQKS